MPVATLENLGAFAAYTVTTPSGRTVEITPDQEEQIARRALEDQLHEKLMASHRLKQVATESAISAVGNAIGIMAGGYVLAKVLGGRPRAGMF